MLKMPNTVSNIKKYIKFKLNLLVLLSFIFIFAFIYFGGEKYVTTLILNKKNDNIVAINIKNPFIYTNSPSTNNPETKNQNLNNKQKNNIANLNSWYWPTTKDYTITTYFSSYHQAIDIYSYTGYNSDIYAANNGTVIEVNGNCQSGNLNCNGKRGNYIIINHNNSNYYSVYLHLSTFKVKVGDTVEAGDIIATMGNTGNVEPIPSPSNPYAGTHLHFCIYKGRPYNGGYAINPLILY